MCCVFERFRSCPENKLWSKKYIEHGWSQEPLHFKKMAKPVKHCIGITSETFVSQRKLSFLDIAPAKSKGTTRTLSKKRYSALGIFNAKSDTVTGTRIGTSTRIGTVNHISDLVNLEAVSALRQSIR